MANKTKFVFGNAANLDSALSEGTVNAFDVLCLKDANGTPIMGWIDKEGNKVFLEDAKGVIKVDELPTADGAEGIVYIYNNACYIWNGTECVPVSQSQDLSAIEAELAKKVDEATVDAKIAEATANMTVEVIEI